MGVRDELHRLTINLLENALRHTPARHRDPRLDADHADGQAQLIVEDDGPGVPPSSRRTLFERFVRGAGDRGGSFGLGLAIVQAVAELARRHRDAGAQPAPARRHGGARFVVRLPARAQTSTTTGSTIGRRLRRS